MADQDLPRREPADLFRGGHGHVHDQLGAGVAELRAGVGVLGVGMPGLHAGARLDHDALRSVAVSDLTTSGIRATQRSPSAVSSGDSDLPSEGQSARDPVTSAAGDYPNRTRANR